MALIITWLSDRMTADYQPRASEQESEQSDVNLEPNWCQLGQREWRRGFAQQKKEDGENAEQIFFMSVKDVSAVSDVHVKNG